MDEVRWGLAGPGGIGERFADALSTTAGGRLVAVGSRDPARAADFAGRHGVARSGSYDDLLGDDQVDAIYVAVPHTLHRRLTVDALRAGKHVLCEKPLALNGVQAQEMVDSARAASRFLMEAMWSRFLPSATVLSDLLSGEELGRPQLVEAAFGFRMPVMPEHRLFSRSLGGGAALDLGIYPLQLCSSVLGQPSSVAATGHVGVTGVDEVIAILLGYSSGAVGVAKAAIRADLDCAARITCERGWLELPPFMHDARVVRTGGRSGVREIECDYEGDGLRFEIQEVHRCLAVGMLESEVMPLDETVQLAGTLDAARRILGVTYADESG